MFESIVSVIASVNMAVSIVMGAPAATIEPLDIPEGYEWLIVEEVDLTDEVDDLMMELHVQTEKLEYLEENGI